MPDIAIFYSRDFYDYDDNFQREYAGAIQWQTVTDEELQLIQRNLYAIRGKSEYVARLLIKPSEEDFEFPTIDQILAEARKIEEEKLKKEEQKKLAAAKRKKEAELKKLAKDEESKRALYEALKQEFEPAKPVGVYYTEI